MVGNLTSVDSYFRTAGVDSHFGIGGIWGSDAGKNLDGVVYQWTDTDIRSAANLDGNWHVISVETADNAPQYASDIAAWTSKQQDAIVNLMVWAHKTHNIPLTLIPDTCVGRRGIAYHAQGVEGNLLKAGCEKWSTSIGKVCPGTRRIAQIRGLITRAQSIVDGVPQPEGFLMALSDAAQIKLATDADHVNDMMSNNNMVGKINDLSVRVPALGSAVNALDAKVSAYNTDLQEVKDAVAALAVVVARIDQKLNATFSMSSR